MRGDGIGQRLLNCNIPTSSKVFATFPRLAVAVLMSGFCCTCGLTLRPELEAVPAMSRLLATTIGLAVDEGLLLQYFQLRFSSAPSSRRDAEVNLTLRICPSRQSRNRTV